MTLSQATRTRLNEWLEWYKYHRTSIEKMPLEGQVAFLLKAVHGSYEMMSQLAREANGEMNGIGAVRPTGIVLPAGVRWK